MKGVQVQILNREKIPDLENAIGMIADEKLRMNVDNGMKIWSDSQNASQVAFVSRKSEGRVNSKNTVSQSSSNVKSGGQLTDHDPRDYMFCNYCKKKRHTKDTCWKLAYTKGDTACRT